MRYQSLNAYRKRFSMKPYTSFEDLTGETNSALLENTCMLKMCQKQVVVIAVSGLAIARLISLQRDDSYYHKV